MSDTELMVRRKAIVANRHATVQAVKDALGLPAPATEAGD